jgi:hypothetical protein
MRERCQAGIGRARVDERYAADETTTVLTRTTALRVVAVSEATSTSVRGPPFVMIRRPAPVKPVSSPKFTGEQEA